MADHLQTPQLQMAIPSWVAAPLRAPQLQVAVLLSLHCAPLAAAPATTSTPLRLHWASLLLHMALQLQLAIPLYTLQLKVTPQWLQMAC